MRWFWLILILLIAGGVYLYLNPQHQGKLRELSSRVDPTTKEARLYKWRNARGEWQITDQLPPEGVDYERLNYRDDVNVLPVPPQLQAR